MVVTSPECFEPYNIIDSCGISASSALDGDTLPGNVILDDDTYWAPAIRTGPGWNNFLSFYMRVKFRLSRINIKEADTFKTR